MFPTGGCHRRRPRNKTGLGALDCSLVDLHADTREKNFGDECRVHHTQVMPTRSRPPRTPKPATERLFVEGSPTVMSVACGEMAALCRQPGGRLFRCLCTRR